MIWLEGVPARDLIALTKELPRDLSPAVFNDDVLLLARNWGEPVTDKCFDVLEPDQE